MEMNGNICYFINLVRVIELTTGAIVRNFVERKNHDCAGVTSQYSVVWLKGTVRPKKSKFSLDFFIIIINATNRTIQWDI